MKKPCIRTIFDRRRADDLGMGVTEYRTMKKEEYAQSRGFSSWKDYQRNRRVVNGGFESYAKYKQKQEEKKLERIAKRNYEINEFNEELIYLLANSGTTQKEVAERLEISESAMSRYVNKSRYVSKVMQNRLIRVLKPRTLERILEL